MSAARQLYNRERKTILPVRSLANQAFSRAAGAPLIEGNSVRLLKDARENYPAWLDATWAPPVIATKVTCALSLAALSSVIPVLIAYELPHMWLERAAGTTGLDLLRSKIWYSRILTLVTPLVVWGAGVLTGTIPFSYIFPLLAECLWLWWLMSSLMGVLSFEMPTRPDLAIIVNGTIGLAIGLVSAMVWPLGLILYPQAMHSLTERGRQRARYYLITESE